MIFAEKLQDVTSQLQGKVPALHLHSIATRIAFLEHEAESLKHVLTQVKQLEEERDFFKNQVAELSDYLEKIEPSAGSN